MGTLVQASNALLNDATKTLAKNAMTYFKSLGSAIPDEDWKRINDEILKGGGLRIPGYIWWAEMVRDGARWDFKDPIKSELGQSIQLCDTDSCDWYEYSMPGNIFYAYVGRVVGFSEFEIRAGAVYAQQTDPENKPFENDWWGLDQKTDEAAISFGFQLYNSVHQASSPEQLQSAFKNLLKVHGKNLAHKTRPITPYIPDFTIGNDGPEFPLNLFDGINYIGFFGG